MSNVLGFIVSGIVGAALGSAVTAMIYRRKCEKEIASVRNAFDEAANGNKKFSDPEVIVEDKTEPMPASTTSSIETHTVNLSKNTDYCTVLDQYKPVVPSGASKSTYLDDFPDIEVIPPESVGELSDYKREDCILYADGILADAADFKMIIESTIGNYALTTFGSYEDNIIYVRNHTSKIDYVVERVNDEWGGQPDFFPPDE